ncbi:ArsR/SmtB family transcription factor [Actinoplanes sp. NPDC049265]|uniref:ArsR/SmtB family transcription factor n=1 Tax=Actinoplanes sp. NPDC049265 TaxID=3363902 RepID=UPI0037201978
MSLGEEDNKAALRALAHPVRLQIMSLLTSAPLTAAEVARELDLTHANASYHLRTLHAGGMIVLAGEEKIRGGVAKRYRYEPAEDRGVPATPEGNRVIFVAAANELIRRTAEGKFDGPKVMADAEVWVDPSDWKRIKEAIGELAIELHLAAKPPRTPGTVRTSTTVAMFDMEAGR